VQLHAVGIRQVAQLRQALQRPERSSPPVGRVLDRDQAATGGVRPARIDEGRDLIDREDAPLAAHRPQQDVADDRSLALLRDVGVGVLVEDDRLAAGAVDREGDHVAHGAGGEEERGVLAGQRRRQLLQLIHGGVFPPLFIPDRRRGHEGTHLSRRTSCGVTREVDHASPLPFAWSLRPRATRLYP
jgi:hypothetical protein